MQCYFQATHAKLLCLASKESDKKGNCNVYNQDVRTTNDSSMHRIMDIICKKALAKSIRLGLKHMPLCRHCYQSDLISLIQQIEKVVAEFIRTKVNIIISTRRPYFKIPWCIFLQEPLKG